MVGALHQDGLRVVLDQVFNHTAASGQARQSVLDKVVPGYYQRLNATGAVETSTCCQNVATEHAMAQKLMVDSVVIVGARLQGRRLPLRPHGPPQQGQHARGRAGPRRADPEKDGVDGKSIYLYGEGWNFGEVADNKLFVQATQGQLGGTGIGTFSDRLRDGVRGGGPFDEDPRRQGFGSGEATDPNGAPVNADAATRLGATPTSSSSDWPATSRRSPSAARRAGPSSTGPRSTTTARPRVTPTSRTRSSATSTPTTTRRSSTR